MLDGASFAQKNGLPVCHWNQLNRFYSWTCEWKAWQLHFKGYGDKSNKARKCGQMSPQMQVWLGFRQYNFSLGRQRHRKALEKCSLTFLREFRSLVCLLYAPTVPENPSAGNGRHASQACLAPQTDAFLFAVILGLRLVSAYLTTSLSNKNSVWHG